MCYGRDCQYEKYDRDWNCTCDGSPTDGACAVISCEVCGSSFFENDGVFDKDHFFCEDCYNNIKAEDKTEFFFKAK